MKSQVYLPETKPILNKVPNWLFLYILSLSIQINILGRYYNSSHNHKDRDVPFDILRFKWDVQYTKLPITYTIYYTCGFVLGVWQTRIFIYVLFKI